MPQFLRFAFVFLGGLQFRCFTSEPPSVENAASCRLDEITSIMYRNGSTCKATTCSKIEIARLTGGFSFYCRSRSRSRAYKVSRGNRGTCYYSYTSSFHPREFTAHVPPPPHVRDVGRRDVSFSDPHFLHGDA